LIFDSATFLVSAPALSQMPSSVGRAEIGTSDRRDLADG
jgi:hypothetical protein